MSRDDRIGHGQLLKGLNMFAGRNNVYYRIGAHLLAHTTPPRDLTCFRNRKRLAEEVHCSVRSIEECIAWLRDEGLAHITVAGTGKQAVSTFDFTPLAAIVAAPHSSVDLHTGEGTSPHCGTASPHSATRYKEKDPLKDPQIKDGAAARATEIAPTAPRLLDDVEKASPEVAALHVSNILSKLGRKRRQEAA